MLPSSQSITLLFYPVINKHKDLVLTSFRLKHHWQYFKNVSTIFIFSSTLVTILDKI